MEWPSTLADGDTLIVRDKTPKGIRFVLHGSRGPEITCRTYAEAEARALSYSEHARGCVWYADTRGLQLIASRSRTAPSPAGRQVGVTPRSMQPSAGEKP